MTQDSNSSSSNEAAAGKSILYQTGMVILGIICTFLITGFIVRTVLTMYKG